MNVIKALFLLLLFCPAISARADKGAVKDIDIQAHRGGAGLMPENTVSAMKNAIDLGVNTLELDLAISSDGKVLVSHDYYFHPAMSMHPDYTPVPAEGPREVLYLMPYDSIARYDVGLSFVPFFPEQKKLAEHKPLASGSKRYS